MTARPPQDVDDHRCWACGRTVAGAVCMGPHEDLRSHPEWCEYVYRVAAKPLPPADRKSTRLNSSHLKLSRMPSSA